MAHAYNYACDVCICVIESMYVHKKTRKTKKTWMLVCWLSYVVCLYVYACLHNVQINVLALYLIYAYKSFMICWALAIM